MEYYERLKKHVSDIRKITDFEPEVAIVLGSGLGNFADNIDVECEISYRDLEGFPFSTAPGHDGKFIFGYLAGKKVVCMKGRVHYYEGYEMSEVVLPMRVMYLLGARTAIITNAVGGMNKEMPEGSFIVIEDAIVSLVPSPLRGPNLDELGERFPDVSELYDPKLIEKALKVGKENNITINKGIFIQLSGPQYETKSEIKMYRQLGADIAGMSSGVEAVAAHHMGMKVCGVSCMTNYCTGVSDHKLSGDEVLEIANRVSGEFEKLIIGIVK